MDLEDILLKKIATEVDLHKPIHILLCFANPETLKALTLVAERFISVEPRKSTITALHLIRKDDVAKIENMDAYKNEVFSELFAMSEANNILVRAFVEPSENYVQTILQMAEKHENNFVLGGVKHRSFNTSLWIKYKELKSKPNNTPQFIETQFEPGTAFAMDTISSLFQVNPRATAMLSDEGLSDIHYIFVPLLDPDDVHIFLYIYLIAQKEGVRLMLWDALGMIKSHPSAKKLFQFICKKAAGKVRLWDEDKKIEYDFINMQDLVMVGGNSWEKLMSSAISWNHMLPSTLIIKDKKI